MSTINNYETGAVIGKVSRNIDDSLLQMPQGIAKAGDVLTNDELSELNIDSDLTVFID